MSGTDDINGGAAEGQGPATNRYTRLMGLLEEENADKFKPRADMSHENFRKIVDKLEPDLRLAALEALDRGESHAVLAAVKGGAQTTEEVLDHVALYGNYKTLDYDAMDLLREHLAEKAERSGLVGSAHGPRAADKELEEFIRLNMARNEEINVLESATESIQARVSTTSTSSRADIAYAESLGRTADYDPEEFQAGMTLIDSQKTYQDMTYEEQGSLLHAAKNMEFDEYLAKTQETRINMATNVAGIGKETSVSFHHHLVEHTEKRKNDPAFGATEQEREANIEALNQIEAEVWSDLTEEENRADRTFTAEEKKTWYEREIAERIASSADLPDEIKDMATEDSVSRAHANIDLIDNEINGSNRAYDARDKEKKNDHAGAFVDNRNASETIDRHRQNLAEINLGYSLVDPKTKAGFTSADSNANRADRGVFQDSVARLAVDAATEEQQELAQVRQKNLEQGREVASREIGQEVERRGKWGAPRTPTVDNVGEDGQPKVGKGSALEQLQPEMQEEVPTAPPAVAALDAPEEGAGQPEPQKRPSPQAPTSFSA